MKKRKPFDHSSYRDFRGKYTVSPDGRVFGPKGEVKYFTMCSGGRFVRLFKETKAVSVTVAKMVMLTFRPRGYRKGMIVIHLDGDVMNDSVKNLRFGTRKEQALIHISKPENWERISRMGRKYGPANGRAVGKYGRQNLIAWREKQGLFGHSEKTADRIRELYMSGMPVAHIARKLRISRSSIYNHI